jgi:hypothetical protein
MPEPSVRCDALRLHRESVRSRERSRTLANRLSGTSAGSSLHLGQRADLETAPTRTHDPSVAGSIHARPTRCRRPYGADHGHAESIGVKEDGT